MLATPRNFISGVPLSHIFPTAYLQTAPSEIIILHLCFFYCSSLIYSFENQKANVFNPFFRKSCNFRGRQRFSVHRYGNSPVWKKKNVPAKFPGTSQGGEKRVFFFPHPPFPLSLFSSLRSPSSLEEASSFPNQIIFYFSSALFNHTPTASHDSSNAGQVSEMREGIGKSHPHTPQGTGKNRKRKGGAHG